MEKLIFDYSKEGNSGVSIDIPEDLKQPEVLLPSDYLRTSHLDLPEVSEPEVVRHYTRLSTLNHHVDLGFYPLGSCTMKYNPKINDQIAGLPGFTEVHPHQPQETLQGALQLIYELEQYLCAITGMHSATLQPAAGSHGELTGVLVMKKYFDSKGQTRKYILIPDSAHGTNPSSACSAGYATIQLKSNEKGMIDLDDLRGKMTREVAGLMLTNPNTLGIFEEQVQEICKIVHEKDGLVYMDGANLNALLGIVRPGDIGFDITHINLHKTFSTPHGGGGPGSGPIAVVKRLEKFLPYPRVFKKDGNFELVSDCPDSIGRVLGQNGNFGVMVRAYVYITMLGATGLKSVSKHAILNANYLKEKIKNFLSVPYDRICMHEFVASGEGLKEFGIKTLDIAKRLLDYGVHAPTVYFPLIVKEALMIEPTESESLETLDQFAEIIKKIVTEASENPEKLHEAPFTTPVRRLNELKANKDMKIRWIKEA